MKPTHGVDHWDPEDCFGCKIQTVSVSAAAMPSRHPGVGIKKRQEKELSQDLDSFKRMRVAGLHPKHTRGARIVESQAESRFEVESGQLAHQKAKGRDAGSDRISQRGKEWRRRTDDAFTASIKDPISVGSAVAK